MQFVPELAGGHVADRGSEGGLPPTNIKLLRRQFGESAKLHSAFTHGYTLPIVEIDGDSPIRCVHLQSSPRRAHVSHHIRLVLQNPSLYVLQLPTAVLVHVKDVALEILDK